MRVVICAGFALVACGAAPTEMDAGVDAGVDGGKTPVHQEWASVADGGCRTALQLDDRAFIFARVCPAPDGGRIGMASQGTYGRSSETELRLTHSLSTCRAQLPPGEKLLLAYERPELVVPWSPPERLRLQADGATKGDGGTTPTALGCLEADGGFTPQAWQ